MINVPAMKLKQAKGCPAPRQYVWPIHLCKVVCREGDGNTFVADRLISTKGEKWEDFEKRIEKSENKIMKYLMSKTSRSDIALRRKFINTGHWGNRNFDEKGNEISV